MPVTISSFCSEFQNHGNDCHFCMTSTRTETNEIVYTNIVSTKRPVPCGESTSPPVVPRKKEWVENENISRLQRQSSFISS